MSDCNLIDGRAIASRVQGELLERVVVLKQRGVVPGLAFIRVGEDPASRVYVGMKEKMCDRLGIHSMTNILPESTSLPELLALIESLNRSPDIHGILVQAPLPPHLPQEVVYASVSPDKDVDGFHPVNVGKLMLGDTSGFVACTPGGVHELLKDQQVPLAGAEVVILGRGNIVGKPLASILMQRGRHADATVTICHSRTRDVAAHCRRADVIVAAMGVPEFLKASMVKPGAVVIDVGVNRLEDSSSKNGYRLVGDVAFDEVKAVAGKITPNPGGVGPMTIVMLMSNTLRAAERLSA